MSNSWEGVSGCKRARVEAVRVWGREVRGSEKDSTKCARVGVVGGKSAAGTRVYVGGAQVRAWVSHEVAGDEWHVD